MKAVTQLIQKESPQPPPPMKQEIQLLPFPLGPCLSRKRLTPTSAGPSPAILRKSREEALKVDHIPLLTPKSSSISLVRKNTTEASISLPLREASVALPLRETSIAVREAKMLVRKEVFGKQQKHSRYFSDRDILKERMSMRIVKVVVWSNSRTVNGLQFFYATEGSSEVVTGNKAVVDNDDYQRLEWDLTEKYDYVKRIVCATSPQGCIDKISFTSANGLKFNAGGKISTKNDITSLTNIPDESINDKENPICAYIGLITFVGNWPSTSLP